MAEAFIAERRYNQLLVAAKPYRILMDRARENLNKAKNDLRDWTRFAPPHRAAAVLNCMSDSPPHVNESLIRTEQQRASAGKIQSNNHRHPIF